MKTEKISDLIKMLKDLKDEFGDLPVYLSSDSEGNSFGTIHGYSSIGSIRKGILGDGEVVAIGIYPWEEGFDYLDIVGE